MGYAKARRMRLNAIEVSALRVARTSLRRLASGANAFTHGLREWCDARFGHRDIDNVNAVKSGRTVGSIGVHVANGGAGTKRQTRHAREVSSGFRSIATGRQEEAQEREPKSGHASSIRQLANVRNGTKADAASLGGKRTLGLSPARRLSGYREANDHAALVIGETLIGRVMRGSL